MLTSAEIGQLAEVVRTYRFMLATSITGLNLKKDTAKIREQMSGLAKLNEKLDTIAKEQTHPAR